MNQMRRDTLASCLAFAVAMAVAGPTAGNGAFADPDTLTLEDASGKAIQTLTVEQLKTEFPQQTYDTRTPWTKEDEKIVYRGPLLKDIWAKTGLANVAKVKVVAYDDFVSELRMDEIQSYAPILAVERQCTKDDRSQGRCKGDQQFRPITMNEKGPIFMVWPFDRLPASYVPARNAIWVFFPVVLRADQ
ncbi:hypothetical protein [Mesorhizobium sp.]|uniref:hypothetical protein n=2 Tax=Mesorhizobium sp. TaxID=1871066 RepID=UPI0011FC14E2|nr:hypothetical protein [Mesorhizobium sp.]TIQ26286.1 MAG: hypothetical protein E5X54_26310 [Mesorhizobium sp.]